MQKAQRTREVRIETVKFFGFFFADGWLPLRANRCEINVQL